MLFGNSDFLQLPRQFWETPKILIWLCYISVFINSLSACMAAAFFYGFFIMK